MSGGGGDTRVAEMESKEALAEQAAISLQRYGEIFVPLENQYIETTLNQFSDQNYNNAMGQAATQAAGVYEQGMADFQNAAMMQRGLDPSMGAYREESAALRAAQARGMGQAMTDAALTNTDQGYQGLSNIVKMGQGLATDTMSGQMELAQNQMDRVKAQAQADFGASSSLRNLAGNVAGQGFGAAYGLNKNFGDD